MAEILREQVRNGSLLSDTNCVEAPVIKVKIGDYTFGVHKKSNGSVEYPNFIQNLTIETINGSVNKYRLVLEYPIAFGDDPNFFEKLFSKASKDRKISFLYGDSLMPPDYIYKDENAIITDVSEDVDIKGSKITYTINAISTGVLTLNTTYRFPARKNTKPSDVIKELLANNIYNLRNVFTGMRDLALVESENLIASDDTAIDIPGCPNLSILEYINVLVNYMRPKSSTNLEVKNKTFYTMTTFEDTTDTFGGPYFKVQKVENSKNVLNSLCTYYIDIGYPTANLITDFRIENNENWSIFYDYNKSLDNSNYLKRIDNNGEVDYVYSPQLPMTK